MMFSKFYSTALLLAVITLWFAFVPNVAAQQTLQAPVIIEENFNDCEFPAGWTTNLTGFSGAVWGVGIPDNTNSNGASIDGTCMVYFDDDASGNNTAPWTAQVTSPAFDGTGPAGSILLLEVDVHFRNWNGSDAFKILVSQNGSTNWVQVAVYQGQNYSGTNFDQYLPAKIDISAHAGNAMRVRFEYNDGGAWNWWAAFDNFKVSQAMLMEDFDDCALPAGWINYIDAGDFGWSFGNDVEWPYNLNGTCMAYFNDDAIGQDAAPSTVALLSPIIDATIYANIVLDVDVQFRAYQGSFFVIGVLYNGQVVPLRTFVGDNFEGYNYNNFGHVNLDLSAYRTTDLRLAFVYGDAGTWAWMVGIDNVKVSGWGQINDLCTSAIPVTVNGPCVQATNVNAIFEGPAAACVDSTRAGIWFSFVAPAGGAAAINSASDFNEVITVFSGNCNALTPIACTNRDEFGFTGERLRLTGLTAGQTYLVRVSGRVGSFGATMGNTCISVTSGGAAPPAPANDNCSGAVQLSLNGNCVSGNNRNATFETGEPLPSLNNRSRASIWYRFTAPAGGKVVINSGADFADVITVYSGNCGALTEVSATDLGHSLVVNGLTPGQTYRIQITGYFATVEGNVCMAITTPPTPPANDLCSGALTIPVDGACVAASNQGATITGPPTNLTVPFTGYTATTSGSTNFYNRPNQGASCTVSSVYVRYDVFTFTVTANGSYTITNSYPQMDGYLHVYANSFNPNNPCATYVAGNDDFNGITLSQVTVNLTAGITYYVVTSAYGANQSGQYSTAITTPVAGAQVLKTLENVVLNGVTTNCNVNPDAAIWFKFTAPASGKIYLTTDADFVHVVSVFAGVCGSLTELQCFSNPSRCGDPLLVTNLTPGQQYFIQVASASTPFGYNYGNICIGIKNAPYEPVKAKIRVLLQGAMQSNGLMTTALQQNNLIPTTNPYSEVPWNYAGNDCADEIPANAVDWVLVELRSATDMNQIVAQKAALLMNTGVVTDKGKDGVRFFGIQPNNSYYIVVRHRNHLAIMSSVAVPLPNLNPYDFSAGITYTMLGNSQTVALPDGSRAMFAGDMNADGVVSVADFNYYQSQSGQINQYLDADCNLDRTVTVADFNIYHPNASIIGIEQIRY
ncbi:MAG TPA: hypothetical protein PK715_00135 [Chitinophagales bacterium]|nr:hypothetical protein [Chitinophagales bacterium]